MNSCALHSERTQFAWPDALEIIRDAPRVLARLVSCGLGERKTDARIDPTFGARRRRSAGRNLKHLSHRVEEGENGGRTLILAPRRQYPDRGLGLVEWNRHDLAIRRGSTGRLVGHEADSLMRGEEESLNIAVGQRVGGQLNNLDGYACLCAQGHRLVINADVRL